MPPLFECSYAGVGLAVPTEEARALVERMIALGDLRDIQPPPRWPGKNLAGIAWADPIKNPTTRLGRLFWPCGAARWSVGRFLASHYQVSQILGKVQPSGGSPPTPQTLTVQCESDGITGTIAAKMYLLPPRPLAGLLQAPLAAFVGTPIITDPADLYLLTLVDARYFWQYAQASSGVGTTDTPEAWSDLIGTTLSDALSVTLTPGSIDSKYGSVEPDSAFWTSSENAAMMLDAALANTGRVLAANYDGTFTIQKVADARDAVKTERLKWAAKRHAGGPVLKLDGTATDRLRDLILPEKVRVTFPQWVDGTGYYRPSPRYRGWALESYDAVKGYDITTTTLTGFSGVQPRVGVVKVFHDTAKARYSASPPVDPPDNDTALSDLATQIAQDYCDGLKSRLDEVYPGVVPWTPDGLNDLLVTYRTDAATTRVQGAPFNSGVTELQHSLGPLEVPVDTANNVKIIRIETYFIQDTNPPVSSPSPVCWYPGDIQSGTSTTNYADTGTKVWWRTPFTHAVWPPVSAGKPYTVVRADGLGYVPGTYAGYSYAPNDNGVHPNSGEERPVYEFADYDAVWGLTCGTVDGVAQIQPVLG